MVSSGRDPDTLSLRDWLDAGYVMLVEGTDATARGLLDDLFDSESDEEMATAFDELRAEMEYRAAQAEQYEREHRRESGAPLHVRRVADGVLEAVVDEWTAIINGEAPEADQGDV